jgi:hypothetical protein
VLQKVNEALARDDAGLDRGRELRVGLMRVRERERQREQGKRRKEREEREDWMRY